MGDDPASRAPDGVARAPLGEVPRWTIRRFATLDSTNRWLLDEARAGAPAGLTVVADHQSAGRGRRGRAWDAPPGSSLLVSVLLRPTLAADRLHLLTMAAALALADAVERVADVRAGLKWPNDLVIGDRKVAGLLAEADLSAGGEVRALVLGVGCNVQWDEFPPELTAVATACNLEAGAPVDRARVLDAFLDRLGVRLGALDQVVADYEARSATLGRRVRVDLGEEVVEGEATGVDDHGRLLLRLQGGAVRAVAVGDVVHLRPASPAGTVRDRGRAPRGC
jgi:BirA family biotin operon repressor/biotin-[acetyl-CoA-carboxylase] ligase